MGIFFNPAGFLLSVCAAIAIVLALLLVDLFRRPLNQGQWTRRFKQLPHYALGIVLVLGLVALFFAA